MLEARVEKVKNISKNAIAEFKRRPWAYLLATGGICFTAAVVLSLPQSVESPEQGAGLLNPPNRVFTTNFYRQDNEGGYFYGPRLVIAECFGATGFEISPDAQGQGFMEFSGGFRSQGRELIEARPYLSANKSAGQYRGTNIVRCYNQSDIVSETSVGYDLNLSE